MREKEKDLSFLDFGGTRRHPDGTKVRAVLPARKAPRAAKQRATGILARRQSLEDEDGTSS